MKTRFYWLSILMLLVALPAWCDIKILHGPYLQNLGEQEATIVWISDKPSVGWLEMAPDDASHFYAKERKKIFDTRIGIKVTSTIHAVKVTGLQPGTRYRYRVCVQEVLEHDGQMIKQCDLKKTDLFLFNGDMVSIAEDQEQLFGGFMDKSVELFAGSVPMYYCRGNHETRGPMAPEFQQYFNPKEEELFYMFRQGPVCFVVLDCGEDKPDTDVEYYGITAYDEYRTKQAEWLKTVLHSDLYKQAPFKVIVCHMPPFGGWHGELDIAEKFIPLLNEANPDVYLCAHLHRTILKNAGEDGVRFPILVNSNNSLLKADVDNKKMDIRK